MNKLNELIQKLCPTVLLLGSKIEPQTIVDTSNSSTQITDRYNEY